jgi:hypothetical protein
MYFKKQGMDINRNNYETFFLLYLDRELNPENREEVERFLAENADLQKEFAILQQTVFVPSEMLFSQKESLYRSDEKRRVVPFYWMRIAAAASVLIIGSWLLIAKSFKSNVGGDKQAQHTLPVQKMPLTQTRKEAKGNQEALSDPEINKQQPELVKNAAGSQIKSLKNFSTAGVQLKSKTVLSEKNNQQKKSVVPDEQNAGSYEILVEPLAVRKSTTPELQSAENPGVSNPKQVAAMSGTDATALVLVTAKTTDQIEYEEAVLKENEYQSDNAISVVSLNNNKGISGFLKKITKRAPAEDQSRKLRVSVFQISY